MPDVRSGGPPPPRYKRLKAGGHRPGFLQRRNCAQIGDIWRGRYPVDGECKPLTIMECIWMSGILIVNSISLCDSLKWVLFPDNTLGSIDRHRRRCFVDFYVLAVGMLAPAFLLWWGFTGGAAVVIAIYLVVEMLATTLKVQFVSIYDKDNSPFSPSRSIVLLLAGYMTVVMCFAILYKAFALVQTSGNTPVPATASSDLVYFSLVTIATVGYGDLVPDPLKPCSRMLVGAEIAVGILMIIVLLSRFMGIGIDAWQSKHKKAGEIGNRE